MTIYIEDCLIENFFVTLLLLLTIQKIFKIKIHKFRLVLSCILGAVFSIIYPVVTVDGWLMFLFKIGVGVLLCGVAFKSDGFVAKFISFMLLTALYGGFNILIYFMMYGSLDVASKFPTFLLLIVLFIVYYGVCLCLKIIQKKYVVGNFVYKIIIRNEDLEIFDTAFLDSGNTLLDSVDYKPIFIININLFNKLYKDISFEDLLVKKFKNLREPHYVNSTFVAGGGKMLVFEVDKLIIRINGEERLFNNAKLGLSYCKFEKNFNCNMLLNINAFV